ncbi:MAG TPA: PQQ-dependent sugar dehydrogenase [Longimicrobium sp.]|nr:PQQ-dependent sugar dehydrogenase [Longimicrobium sp.]
MTRMRLALLAVPALALAACSGGRGAAQNPGSSASIPAPTGRPADASPWQTRPAPRCDRDNGGLTLSPGFCALVVADSLGPVRHLAVAANGDIYAALAGGRNRPSGALALRDTNGDGRMDVRRPFGSGAATGMEIHDGWLYFAPDDAIVRWRLTPGELMPQGSPQHIVTGLPSGGHAARSMAFDGRGNMFVNVGSRTNACQTADRQAGQPGQDPCRELETRAGTWRFAQDQRNQTQAQGERWATGIRNGLALDWNVEVGALFAVSHGRDQLTGWPGFTEQMNAENPAEEMFRLDRGTDGGWPYCYFDPVSRRKVLAPEYGGNGRETGRCPGKAEPVYAFPAHWAPNDLVFYTGTHFPQLYRGGAFVAFHGSWNRAPLPQQGYNVVFLPFRGGRPFGQYEVFATGFAGVESPAPNTARHRPTGLAVGPDGSLYVSDDVGGRIWRIRYVGTGG